MGSPLKTAGNLSPELQEILQKAAYTSFERIVNTAIEHDVDFMLISGDVYDNDSRSVAANRFFADQMERLEEKDIPVFIIYGNHDPLSENTELFKLPDNVKIFDSAEPEIFEAVDKRGRTAARIIGQSYRTPSETRKMHQNFSLPDDGLLNIGMLHTALDASANIHVPCSLEELKNIPNIHYWALGHIHKPQIVSQSLPAAAYPGIPQGRDMGEQGIRGFLLIEADSTSISKIHFIPTSSIIWVVREISIDNQEDLDDISDLEELIINASNELKENTILLSHDSLQLKSLNYSPEGYIVRWIITGRGSIHERVLEGREEETAHHFELVLRENLDMQKPFIWTESVRINTHRPMPSLEELVEKDEIISMLVDFCSRVEKEPELKKKALDLVGSVWHKPQNESRNSIEAVHLTEEKFQYLLKLARDTAVEHILKERDRIEDSQNIF
ncbi:MAG: putative phosphoesterase [Clostridia bacterium 41_269]|nr:MAG: putative phosphoesterase [Clostridia bacterium 41_269]